MLLAEAAMSASSSRFASMHSASLERRCENSGSRLRCSSGSAWNMACFRSKRDSSYDV